MSAKEDAWAFKQNNLIEGYGNKLSSIEGHIIPVPEPKRLQPATPADLEYRDGDILQIYELGEKLANTENGGQGTIYRAKRKSDGLDTVVKVYAAAETGNWDDIFTEEKRAGREIRFLERANREGVPGVPRIVQHGVTGSFIKTPVAVFDFIPGKSLEEEVLDQSYSPSAENVLGLFSGLVPALEYAHHSNGVKPVVHRDINPGNIKVNGHPVLMDWASSTPTSGKTQLRTHMFTEYFTAPEVVGGSAFDGRADIYSMGKVLQFMLLGQVFKDADGNPKTSDFDRLNIPKEVAQILAKATQENPDKRYKTVREFYHALESVFQTGRSMPTRNELLKHETAKPGDCIVKINEDGSVHIGYFEPELPDKPHCGNTFEGKTVYDIFRAINTYLLNIGSDEATLAYAKHVAQTNPLVRGTLEGKRTLEDVAREKKPRFDITDLLEKIPFVKSSRYPEPERDLEEAKDKYLAKRKQLYEIFGVKEMRDLNVGSVSLSVGGSIVGVAAGTFSAFNLGMYDTLSGALFAMGTTVIGAILGLNIGEYIVNKKLQKKAREVDSWIREAKRAQGLEGKVGEGEIKLTEEEITRIKDDVVIYRAGIPFLGALIDCGYTFLTKNYGVALGALLSLPLIGETVGFLATKYLKNKKLKQKRLTAGLDEDGMKAYAGLITGDSKNLPSRTPKLEKIFSVLKLKKSFLKQKFKNSKAKVKLDNYRVIISALPSEELRAKNIYDNIRQYYEINTVFSNFPDHFQPFQAGVILSDETKMPDVRRINGVGGVAIN